MVEKMSYFKQRATKSSNLVVDHIYHFARIMLFACVGQVGRTVLLGS